MWKMNKWVHKMLLIYTQWHHTVQKQHHDKRIKKIFI